MTTMISLFKIITVTIMILGGRGLGFEEVGSNQKEDTKLGIKIEIFIPLSIF